ncbi:MAG: copper chaperone PCu(A)C [Xanthomonadaceae bacterium]|nr:copper chaperone PCu(A)C [Xanthomonadaceae bacterium]MDE2498304.1 copper chaperone PCu(A)C [Xanthomonadaceae bacterium]
MTARHARDLLRAFACAGLIATCASAPAAAPASAVRIEQAWIRWLPANLPAAGYATIVNDSDGVQRLTGVSSPDYGLVMLHRSRLAQGDSTMEMVDHLDIPAHGSVKLAPGGYHLMLSHAKRPVKPGDKVPMRLRFADGSVLQVDFSVLPANASGP